jgi:hypothetical protein
MSNFLKMGKTDLLRTLKRALVGQLKALEEV